MKKSLVSIIVPVYNCYQYIDRCLDSLLKQTYDNIEVIVVDDGSTDCTSLAIKDYEKKDSRIKFFNQLHAGPNVARQKGIDAALGDYVMFVDGDDFIDRKTVEKLISYIEKYKVDAVRFDGRFYPSKRQLASSDFCTKNHLVKMKHEEIEHILLTTYNLNSLCLHIYKTELVKGTRAFNAKISYGEDFLANLEILTKAEKLLVIKDNFYYYFNNPHSTTRNVDRQRILKNFSDRVYVGNRAIKYAYENISNDAYLDSVVYSQIKMMRDSLVNFINIQNYHKNDFLKDIGLLISKEMFKQVDLCRIEKYIKTRSFTERIKNEKVVKAILTCDYQSLWSWIRLWRGVLKIKFLHSERFFEKNKHIGKYMRGRLGNQLFQYAALRQIQEVNGGYDKIKLNFSRYVYSKGFGNDLRHFRIAQYEEVEKIKINIVQRAIIFKDKVIKRVFRFLRPKEYRKFRYDFENRRALKLQKRGIYWKEDGALKIGETKTRNQIAIGHFESAKNFDKIRPQLLEEIQPIEPPLEKNKKLYEIIDKKESVCISIRRGDFVENPEFAKNYNVCGKDYFKNAVKEIKKHIKNPTFIMFSDDIDWCKKNILLPDEELYYEDGTDPVWEKLRLMYSCKHFIISNSTFSWWAQYLSRNESKIVVAPKIWTNYGYDTDIYDESWVIVDNQEVEAGK